MAKGSNKFNNNNKKDVDERTDFDGKSTQGKGRLPKYGYRNGKFNKPNRSAGRNGQGGAKERKPDYGNRDNPIDRAVAGAGSNRICVGGTNGPEWYTNRSVTGLSGTYSWNTPIGVAQDVAHSQVIVEGTPDTAFRDNYAKWTAPGIMVMELAPMFGGMHADTTPQASPLNVAANKVYAYVRHANSGARNYQKSDVTVYMGAVADAYSYYGLLTGVYGTLNKFSTFNRYWGESIIKARGCDPDDLWKYQTNLKTYINQYAARINVLKIPDNWPYFLRKNMLYSNVYLDEPSEKAQLLMFMPQSFCRFATDTTDGHMYLEAAKITHNGSAIDYHGGNMATFDDLRRFGDSLIDNILLDSDIALMSGDIQKAYANTFALHYVDESYTTPFVFDEGINLQISNAVVWENAGWYAGDRILDQRFDDNGNDSLINRKVMDISFPAYSVVIPDTLRLWTQKQLFNTHNSTVSEGELLEGTRLMILPTDISYNDDLAGVTAKLEIDCNVGRTGTEIMTRCTIIYGLPDESGQVPYCIIKPVVATALEASLVAQFNVHPMFYRRINSQGASATTTGYSELQPLTLLDNYVHFDVLDLYRLHEAALLSLFDVN